MRDRGAERDRERVAAWLGSTPIAELLPVRRREAPPMRASVRPLDVMPLDGRAPDGRALGGRALAVAAVERDVLVVPLAGTGPIPRRAVAGDGAFASMLHAIRDARVDGAFRAESFGGSLGAVRDDEAAIDVDQSNDSVVVGGSVVVKLFPLTAPGPQPGLDLPCHLSEVGFTALPTPLGALHWTMPDGRDVVLATAASYLSGARDGWTWYLERLVGWLDGEVDDVAALEPASVLGSIAGRMHAALATPSEILPRPKERADERTADAWRRSALSVADEALETTDGEVGARLAARADRIRSQLDRIASATGTITTRVHGDFHLGQVLEWRDRYAITDFDGDPTAPPGARGSFDTPVRDVAAFVRSVDHLGRLASLRRAGREDAVETWIANSRARFLDAYRHELELARAGRLFDERLLRPLEVAQACHEYVYAARFLPRWRAVADLAMRALVPGVER